MTFKLHSAGSISDDRKYLQNEMFEKSIILSLENNGQPMPRERLLNETLKFLGSHEARKEQINGRIDALLGYGKIEKISSGISLSKSTKNDLQIANGIYDKELEQLTVSQSDLINEYGGSWSSEMASRASILLAKSFVEEQFLTAKHAARQMSILLRPK